MTTRPTREPYKSPRLVGRSKRVWTTPGGYHRLNGPAIEEDDGSKWWFLDGIMSRVELVPDNPRFEARDFEYSPADGIYHMRYRPEQ